MNLNFFMRLIIRYIANILGLLALGYFVAGVTISKTPQDILVLALVITLANLIVRPILKLVFFPLIILTLGLFTIVINALILGALDRFFASITINGLGALLLATILMSLVNFAVSVFTRGFRKT